jgi:lysine decarboxylase
MMNTILTVYDSQLPDYKMHFIDALEHTLSQMDFEVEACTSLHDAIEIAALNPRISCILYDWDDFGFEKLHLLADRNHKLPIFAIANKHADLDINLSDFNLNLDFLQYDANLVQDDVDRIIIAMDRYHQAVIPPFTKALMHYVDEHNYTFCTPGHLGGTAFQKTPVGAAFYDFLGPNVFKSDISISIGELGSLLDHSGPHRAAEKFIADTFGSDRSLIVTNGTSTSNKIVGMYCATGGETVLIDRNCHKSLTHFLMMTDVVPLYLKPTRNAYGILGGIPRKEFSKAAINAKLKAHPHAKTWPTYAVITNSTYDGLFYNVRAIQKHLKVTHLHFDSAWVPYTNFHPIYKNKYGMSLTPEKGQVIFETQSTHKLLAAFSQASMVHVKGEYSETVLNENFMMHTTTSPFYPLVASCEVSAAMMRGKQGYHLMNESIELAMDFRREIKRLKKSTSDWYYDVWQPANVKKADCYPLKAEDKWHGFKNIDADHMYLDPVKVTVLLPGITAQGKLAKTGIPASIVEKFLSSHGIIVEKTGPYSMLFLFSVGVTKAKAMNLLASLNKFKHLYDKNVKVREILPELYAEHPDFYHGLHIQDLAGRIHALIVKHNLPKVMYHAFDVLPKVVLTPHQAYKKLIKQSIKRVPLKSLLGKTAATMILPYPPGVPLVMPGEQITKESEVILEFLLMLDDIGGAFPGFETEIHGADVAKDGVRYVQVIAK